jgi:hypothetical protein
MTFLLPLGLLALLTLPVILVLHLLRERRRRVAVPSLQHWLNVPRRREGERIRRLPLTLLLLLHLLVAGLLGLALGRPQLAGVLSGPSSQTAIVIDTSTSMAAREGTTTRFALAQDRARAVLRRMSSSDRATLIAAGPAARVVASGGAGDVAALTAALGQLRPGGAGTDIAGALTLAEASFDRRLRRQIVVLSDGALPPPAIGTLETPVDWQQVGGNQPNRAVIAFAARPWGANLQVYARVANYGPTPFASTLQLSGDERPLGIRNITIASGGQSEITWTLPASYRTLRADLDGRDPLPQDDQAFLNLAQIRPVKALLVSAKPDVLRRALTAVPGVSATVVDPSGYAGATASGHAADLTVFDGFLPTEWPAGSTLAINPPAGSALLDVKLRPTSAIRGQLSQRGALLEGLSLGGINFGVPRSLTRPPWAEAQLAIGTAPLILRGRSGAHEIAIWTFDLAAGNLPTRLAFPLLVARTVRDLTPPPLPPNILAGAPLTLRPDPRAAEIQIAGPDDTIVALPIAPALTLDTLTQPGFYKVEERSGGATFFRGQVGVNAGAAVESDLRPKPTPQIGGPPQQPGDTSEREMTDLWPLLALGALAALMIEWGYIHR